MKTRTHYKLLIAITNEELEEKVMDHLDKGWELYGDPLVIPAAYNDTGPDLGQAVVLKLGPAAMAMKSTQ